MRRRTIPSTLLLTATLLGSACGGAASVTDSAVSTPDAPAGDDPHAKAPTPALPGHRVVADAHVQVHGADPAAIKRAHEEATYAVDTFRTFTGERSKPVAIVIFDDPKEMATFDHRRFRKEGAVFFPWVSEEYIRIASRSVRMVEPLQVVLHNAEEGIQVIAPLPAEQAADFTFELDDVLLTLDGTPIQDAADFAERFGTLDAGANVSITYRRAGSEQTAQFAKSTPAQENPAESELGDSVAQQISEARPLSHEVCHILLISHTSTLQGRKLFNPAASQIPGGDYGHPDLPDWFDESVATLCEYPALQDSRRKTLTAEFDAHIPLAELLTMEHPSIAAQEAIQKQMHQQPAEGDGARVTVMVSQDDGDDASAQRELLFYAQALAVGEFLVEREGPAVIGQLTQGFIEGLPLDTVLEQAGGIDDVEALESEWAAWVKAK